MGLRDAILALGVSATCGVAIALGPTSLDRFFSDVVTFRARFEQVVLDEDLNRIEESAGEVWISRPGKFRWDYEPPLEQQIVSDGEQVWVYDADLAQVTLRPLTNAIGTTPAILLAGEGDVKGSFHIRDLGHQGNLEWIGLTPKDSDEGYEDIRIAFEDTHLRVLEFIDGLGQMTRITLEGVQENLEISDSRFDFVPPPGVDVFTEDQ